MSDVWEIPFLNPRAKERTGYPTQKPLTLLNRIIEISTKENDIVLDPFCGSGTSMVAAKINNRRFLGFDINPEAIEVCNHRLNAPIVSRSIVAEKGYDFFKNKNDLELKILKHFNCHIVERNNAIDGIADLLNKKIGIKIQKEYEKADEVIKK